MCKKIKTFTSLNLLSPSVAVRSCFTNCLLSDFWQPFCDRRSKRRWRSRTVIRRVRCDIVPIHPLTIVTVFFIDLLKFYNDTIPPTILKKKRESERPIPVKKRTAPIDQRMSRSRLSAQGLDPHDIIQSQITHSRSASISRSRAGSVARPPVPALPPVLADPAIHPPPPTTGDEDPDAPPPRPKFAEPNDSEDLAQELFISPPTPQRVPFLSTTTSPCTVSRSVPWTVHRCPCCVC